MIYIYINDKNTVKLRAGKKVIQSLSRGISLLLVAIDRDCIPIFWFVVGSLPCYLVYILSRKRSAIVGKTLKKLLPCKYINECVCS